MGKLLTDNILGHLYYYWKVLKRKNFDGLFKSGNISLIKKLHYTVLQTTAKHLVGNHLGNLIDLIIKIPKKIKLVILRERTCKFT